MSDQTVVIRNFPYPYRAAISISDDPDFQSFAYFEELYKFINTSQNTRLGIGLGLEVSAGIFFYSANPYNYSYYANDGSSQFGPYASRLDQYLQSGRTDTNHGYGDFDHAGGFTRAYAERVTDRLESLAVKLPIFTNHGDAHNIQNVGAHYPGYLGDDKTSTVYHVDLSERAGTRFVWSQDMVVESGAAESVQFVRDPLKHASSAMGFTRFRGTGYHAPNLSSFSYQLSRIDWDRLYSNGQAIVIYQHLGVVARYARHCIPATIDDLLSNQYLLSGFYKLREETQKGLLWVPALSRLLQYKRMIDSIRVEEVSYNTFIIHADADVCCEGLTLYANTQDIVHVYRDGILQPIVYNGPDDTGYYSVSIPMRKLSDIW